LHFVRDITRERQVEQEVARERDVNAIVAEVLGLAVAAAPLEQVLDVVLERLIGIPWLGVEARGGIFLTEGDPPVLALTAQRDMPPTRVAGCRLVPHGYCLCGRAAASGRLEFATDVDERHECCDPDLPPHGHYCVPIVSQQRVLGVINLYVPAGQPRDSRAEALLHTVASVLAGIVARHRTEAQLRHSQKLEALGMLASGVAHDFNNLLTVILGHADALDRDLGADPAARHHAERIKAVVKRAATLTHQLVTFSRRKPPRTEIVEVNAVVEDVRKLLAELIGRCIEFEVELGAPGGSVHVDRGELEQVLVNLVVNARDAMPDGGRLRIATRSADLSPGPEGAPAGRYVTVSVTDTGVGIPPDLASRIFEPFFTTKAVGQGSGLGLAIAEGILREAGGRIHVTSVPGQGATFTIYLPSVAPPPAPRP
jgi:signal transduction histidine kinase